MQRQWGRAAGAGALAVALGAGALTGCSAGGDGPDGNGAAAGDATTTTVAPDAITPEKVGNLVEAWRVDGQVGVTGKPTVRDGIVYFGNWIGSVQAVDLRTGEMRWQTQGTADASVTVDGALLVTDDLVYAADGDGKLHALDRETGELRWTQTLDTHPDTRIYSTPVLAPDAVDGKDVVIVGVASTELRRPIDDFTFRGSVVALDAASGEEAWRLPVSRGDDGAGSSVWSSAVIDEERKLAFIGTGQAYEHPAGGLSDSLLAIDFRTGLRRAGQRGAGRRRGDHLRHLQRDGPGPADGPPTRRATGRRCSRSTPGPARCSGSRTSRAPRSARSPSPTASSTGPRCRAR
jgi:outer membrane protein assembly factor BamB